MTNDINEQLVEKTMQDMLETLKGVEKYVLVAKIVDLQQRIDKSIEYLLKNRDFLYDDYVKVIDILRGKEVNI